MANAASFPRTRKPSDFVGTPLGPRFRGDDRSLADAISRFDESQLLSRVNPSALQNSLPTPWCTVKSPSGSYFFFTASSRA